MTRYIQNIAFLVLVNLIVKPFWILGIDRTVQNTVGHEVYGIYQAVFNITVIFQILLDFGLQAYNSRVVAQSPMAMRNLFANIFVVKVFFALIFLVITISYGLYQGFDALSFKLLLVLSLMQIALSFLLFFRSNIAALQKFNTDSLFSIFDRVIAIVILGIFLFSSAQIKSDFNIEWYAWVQLFAYAVAAIAAFFVCRHLQKIEWKHFKFKKIWIVIKQSVPYAILIFLMAIYMRIDVVLLENISADSSLAGRYAAAYRILDVSNNMSGVLIAGILLPLFSNMISKKEDYKSVVNLSVNILFPLSVCLAVICAFWGYDIMNLMYKDIQPQDGQILLWLMCSFPLYCINYIYATLLTANGNIKTLIGISVMGVLVALVLNLSMLSEHNAMNAVITAHNTFLTILSVAVANLYFSHKKMSISWGVKQVFRFATFAILLVALSYFLFHNLERWHLFIKIGVIVFASIVLILATGIIKPQSLVEQIKKRLPGH